MSVEMTVISSRIPKDTYIDWVHWCDKHRASQADVIRHAIARLIEADDSATNAELATAAMIEELPETRMPRRFRRDFQLRRPAGSP